MSLLKGTLFSWMFMVYTLKAETCTLHVENVNCTGKESTNIHYTCHSSSREKECTCTFDNPLQSELGWYKMCKTKSHLITEKKNIRKRQIARHDNCGTMQPPQPGKASCFVTARGIACTGSCEVGYRFVDGDREQTYSCSYSEGTWKPKSEFPICEPECLPACNNGGNCTAPNFCSCSNDFRGDVCQYALKLCGLSRNRLASSWQCSHNRMVTACNISCHAPGTIEAETKAQKYVCSVDGNWESSLPPCVQAVQLCDDPGTIDHAHRVTSSSTFTLGSWVSFECDEGYVIAGESKITCQSDGQWTPNTPRCFLIMKNERNRAKVEQVLDQCSKPNAPKNSIVHFSFPDQRPLQSLFNSQLPLIQRLSISVRANFSRSLDIGLAGLPDGLFQIGTRVQYKCKSHFYKLYGSEYQTCLGLSTWSGYQPACVPECGKSDSPKTPFVVNGHISQVGQWPWITGLAVKGSKGLQYVCGGVLVSENWVLTAAHCVTRRLTNVPMDERTVLVFCGKYYRKFAKDDEYVQAKQVKQIIVHEEYDFTHYDADIALLQLESAVELTARVRPICLPTEVTARENLRDGQKGIVLGWGLTENGTYSETLRETILPVVSHDKCEEAYREGLRTVTITQNMFCAGHESGASDTCNGDSGGPFMFSVGPAGDRRWHLEGLVSWGSESGCAKANLYSGFTKVARFVPWINMFI